MPAAAACGRRGGVEKKQTLANSWASRKRISLMLRKESFRANPKDSHIEYQDLRSSQLAIVRFRQQPASQYCGRLSHSSRIEACRIFPNGGIREQPPASPFACTC